MPCAARKGEAMALTRGDKMIIAGAAALAVTVVLGLAVIKKPHLFGLGDKSAPADIPPAPAAAATRSQARARRFMRC